jgi:NTE family protein
MIGLALEGGGSRGAYHIGVMKAYAEAGYRFDGFVGTSIGAINAAAFAQGDSRKAEEMWDNLTTEQLFDTDVCKLIEIGESKRDINRLADVRNGLRKIRAGHGIDTIKIKTLVSKYIDEKKLRSSGNDYGLVTISVNERRPYELYLENIQHGSLIPYIVASACFPGFRPEVINGNILIDGAFYNNCPVNMLIEKGYDEIIAVRTNAPGVFRKNIVPKGVRVKTIVPKCDLGNMMIFSPEKIKSIIRLGYHDGWQTLREV